MDIRGRSTVGLGHYIQRNHPDMNIAQPLQRCNHVVVCLAEGRVALRDAAQVPRRGCKAFQVLSVETRHITPHALHKARVGFLVVLRWRGLPPLRQFVVNIEEQIKRVHDATLSCGWARGIMDRIRRDAFKDPLRLLRPTRRGTDPPRATVPVERLRVDGFPHTSEGLGHVLDDSLERREIVDDLVDRGGVGGVGKGHERLDDLEHLDTLELDGSRGLVERSLSLVARQQVDVTDIIRRQRHVGVDELEVPEDNVGKCQDGGGAQCLRDGNERDRNRAGDPDRSAVFAVS